MICLVIWPVLRCREDEQELWLLSTPIVPIKLVLSDKDLMCLNLKCQLELWYCCIAFQSSGRNDIYVRMSGFHSEFNWTICCSVNRWDVAQMAKFPDRWAPYMCGLDEANCPNRVGNKGFDNGFKIAGAQDIGCNGRPEKVSWFWFGQVCAPHVDFSKDASVRISDNSLWQIF